MSIEYQELIALTQLHLFENFSASDWILSDATTTDFFRQYARQQKAVSPSPLPNNVNPTIIKDEPKSLITKQEPASVSYKEEKKALSKVLKEELAASSIPLMKEENVSPEKNPSQKEKSDNRISKFQYETLKANSDIANFSDIKAILQERFPHQKIIDHIPEKKRAAHLTFPPVLLLTSTHSPQEKEFVESVAKAIHSHLCPAELLVVESLEQEQFFNRIMQSTTVKLIISHHILLEQTPALRNLYKEEAEHPILGHIPVILLKESVAYLKEPALKKELWHSIKTRLAH